MTPTSFSELATQTSHLCEVSVASSPRPPTKVYTQCRICVASCGLEVTVDEEANRVLRIAPDKQNPHTWKDFCPKGRTAAELVEHPRRILSPMRRVGDRYEPASYEEAIEDIAARLRSIIDRHGPDAVASYHGNPAGFSLATSVFLPALLDAIGTGNRYWVGSIDQNNAHVVADLMFGSPLLFLTSDIDEARCFLLIGTNPAVSAMNWIESAPDGWRRVLAAQSNGADLIVVDPRRTESADRADTHVAVRPGQDWAFLLALVKVIFESGWEDRASCAAAAGVDAVRSLAAAADLDDLGQRCDVPVEQIRDVARRFALAPTGFCVTRTGVSQTNTGTVAEWLGLVLNLIAGRIDAPGGRRYERGLVDLPKLYASIATPTNHRTRLRRLPTVAGYHALAELPSEITTTGLGQIKAMFLVAGNPVVSGPDGRALDDALAQLDLLVAVDLIQRESHRHAHWLLPGMHWLEREELHVLLNCIQDRPYVQYGHQAVEPPPSVRAEWEFFCDLALALRRPLFGKRGVNSLVKVSRWLARHTGRPGLAFSPRWVERAMVLSGRRVRWRDILAHPHGWVYGEKEYGRLREALQTPDKRVHAAPDVLVAEARRLLAAPSPRPPDGYPFAMTNRRRHDAMNSWLNDLPGLHRHRRTNELEIHPADAERLGLATGDVARLSSPVASIEVPVRVTDAVRPTTVCVEHGWGSRVFDPVGGAEPEEWGANRNLLTDNRDVDPLSQVASFNTTWVHIEGVSS